MRQTTPLLVALTIVTPVLPSCWGGTEVTAEALHGIWVSLDNTDGSIFVIEMQAEDSTHPDLAGVTDVYYISRYMAGEEHEPFQRGRYEVRNEDGKDYWVTMPTWSEDGSSVGGTFANEIFSLRGSTLELESTAVDSGMRTLHREESYP